MPLNRSFTLIAAVLLGASGPVQAQKRDEMLFRNNLLPGQLTEHVLIRTTQRVTQKPRHAETLIWQQQARIVQCNIDESTPGSVMVYQMVVDRPPQVMRVLHGDVEVKPLPKAALFNLPSRSTRLHSATMTARDAPIQAPLADRLNRTLVEMVLDFAHWPAARVVAGHRWQHTIKLEDFAGAQTLEFVGLTREGGEVAARVKMSLRGKFTGKLERDYVFNSAEAEFLWSRPDRTLLRLEARVQYERRREPVNETFETHIAAALTDLRQLDENEQELVKVQLTQFSGAMKELQRGHQVEALRRCRDFRERWPTSRWLPAVAQLESQASPKEGGRGKLSLRQLKTHLAQSIIVWEASRSSDEHDLAEKTQRTFSKLAEEYGEQLVALSREQDDSVRASAAFALAFSERPGDLDRVQRLLRDGSTQVRSMALAGLAARRAEGIKPAALLKLLEDPEAAVRRRACQAIAACIPPEHFSIVDVVEKIDRVMIHDDKEIVRREAVRTLAVIGAPADIPKLEQALRHELNHAIRKEIDAAIEALRSKE